MSGTYHWMIFGQASVMHCNESTVYSSRSSWCPLINNLLYGKALHTVDCKMESAGCRLRNSGSCG